MAATTFDADAFDRATDGLLQFFTKEQAEALIQFRGDDALRARVEDLALACIDCNLHKGTNVASYDPETGVLTELFHPRHHVWTDHFEWQGLLIVGRSAIGRSTVMVLNLNADDQRQLRMEFLG